MSTVDVINISSDRQKFMTVTGELSWHRLRWSAVPGIWLCPPKFNLKWFTWLSGMPYHPRASNWYRQSTYQIWSLCLHSLRRYERRYKMSKMGWFGVVRVTQGPGNSTNQYSTYEFLLAFHSNCVPVLHHLWGIARYWLKIAVLTYPTSIWRPRWGDPVGISSNSLASGN